MELELFYPALTLFSCDECQAYMYDVDWEHGCTGTGRRKKHCGGTIETKRITPPPCHYDKEGEPHACPKESPAKEHEHLLSADNWLTWQLWREVRATNGARLTEAMRADGVLMENLSLLDDLLKKRERRELAREIALNLAGFIRQ